MSAVVVLNPREHLLEAAGEVFADKGFDAATVSDITGKAGMNRAAVSYYFGGMKELYLAAVRHAHQSAVLAVPLPEWPDDTPPEAMLRDFIRCFLRRVAEDREPSWHGRLLMREVLQPTDACAQLVREFVRPTFEVLARILGQLLPPDFPEERRRLVAFSIVGQCLHYRFARPVVRLLLGDDEFRRYDLDLLTDHITGFTLAGLGLTPPVTAKGGQP